MPRPEGKPDRNPDKRKPDFTRDDDRPTFGLAGVDDGVDVRIGGPGKDFRAKVRADRWMNPDPRFPSCWLDVEARGVEESQSNKRKITTGKRRGHDRKILTSEFGRKNASGKHTTEHHEWYLGNSLDWDVVFTDKSQLPEERSDDGEYVLHFDLSNPPGLSFHLQPELTPAEVEAGHVRPENVVFSYAAHFNHAGRFLDRKRNEIVNYGPGKFGHLYRPLVILPDGEEIYTGQWIDGTDLHVFIPEAVVNAWNPSRGELRLDPTFGYTSVGSSSYLSVRNTCLVGSSYTYTATAGDSVTDISAYSRAVSTTRSRDVGIYDISSSVPQNRTGYGSLSITTSAQWHTLSSLSIGLSGGTIYGPAFAASSNVYHYYDTSSGTITSYTAIGVGSLNDPWVEDTSVSALWSIYATYSAGTPAAARRSKPFIDGPFIKAN